MSTMARIRGKVVGINTDITHVEDISMVFLIVTKILSVYSVKKGYISESSAVDAESDINNDFDFIKGMHDSRDEYNLDRTKEFIARLCYHNLSVLELSVISSSSRVGREWDAWG